jgi:hypothetical protein
MIFAQGRKTKTYACLLRDWVTNIIETKPGVQAQSIERTQINHMKSMAT